MKKIHVKPVTALRNSTKRAFSSKKGNDASLINKTSSPVKVENGNMDKKKQFEDMFAVHIGSELELKKEPGTDKEEKVTPPLQDSSIRELWQNFRNDTTMHGLKHASHREKYKLRWIIWAAALIVMGTFLIINICNLFLNYVKHPTLSNINVEIADSLPFPAVTVCNLSPYKKSSLGLDAALEHYYFAISRMGVFVPPINYSDPLYASYFTPGNITWLNETSNKMSDLFLFCVYSGSMIDCSSILEPKITEWGICYTYNSLTSRAQNGQLFTSLTGSTSSLTFYLQVNQDEYIYNANMGAGMKIIVHDPEEEPDVVNKGFLTAPGFASYASLKMSKYKYLPYPYKAAGDHFCLDTKSSSFDNPLKYYPTYSRTGCLRECKRDYIVGRCSCRAHTDPGDTRICSLAEYDLCYRQISLEFDSNSSYQSSCNCRMPCEFTSYETTVTTAYFPATVYNNALAGMGFSDFRTHFMEVNIYFDTLSYLNIEHIPQYDFEDIVGILGGQMGIFLGASLLTLSELLEFVLLSMYVSCKRCYHRLTDH